MYWLAILNHLKEGRSVTVANDLFVSLTYIPDLVHQSLNMLLDSECGIFHVSNYGQTTHADLARKIAEMAGFDPLMVRGVASAQLEQKAPRPKNIALQSEKGIRLPEFESALKHYLDITNQVYQPETMAV